MNEKITSRFNDLRGYAIERLTDFLGHNQKVFVIKSDNFIAYNIILNKDKIYADEIEKDYEMLIQDLSLDELYRIFKYLEATND